MPTRPDPSTSSGADAGASAFAGLGGGLSFFQDWLKAASSAMPLGGQSTSGSPHWAMPTLDPEELDKRIQDLKTVQFWLEQNARMIGMTIQTLEVQRMTLNTLRSMNMPLDAVRDSLKATAPTWDRSSAAPAAKTDPSPAPSTAHAAPEATEAQASGEASAAANPLHWWNTLTTQFTALAQQAVQAGQDAVAATATPTPHSTAARSAKRTPRKAASTHKPRKASKADVTQSATKPSSARKRGTATKTD